MRAVGLARNTSLCEQMDVQVPGAMQETNERKEICAASRRLSCAVENANVSDLCVLCPVILHLVVGILGPRWP